MNKPFLLYEDFDKINWDKMPFPRDWAEGALLDKLSEPVGYLRVRAYDCSKIDPNYRGALDGVADLVYDYGGGNQIMYWFKRAYAMMESGVIFNTAGEHKGYEDNSITQTTEAALGGLGWTYNQTYHSTHAWISSTDTLGVGAAIPPGTNLFPFFPTKMRFGEGGPVAIATPIDPAEINLNDVSAQGPGNAVGKYNFIYIERESKIAFTTTGYDPSSPSGYYDDYGSVFKNISVYQITMPQSMPTLEYDDKTLNEAGLFCDASIVNTKNSAYDQTNGMLLAKRYFNPITKTNTISINFQWSIVK